MIRQHHQSRHTGLRKAFLLSAAILVSGLNPITAYALRDEPKPTIESEADIPRADYMLPDLPSVLVLDTPNAMDTLAVQLQEEVEGLLSDYVIQDEATQRRFLITLLRTALYLEEWQKALGLIDTIADLEGEQADRAGVHFMQAAYARAALSAGTGNSHDERFQAEFRDALTAQVARMELSDSEAALRGAKNTAEILSTELMRGGLEGRFDPSVTAQDYVVTRQTVSAIIANQQLHDLVPLGGIIAEVIGARLASEHTERVDAWSPRQVSFEGRDGLTPVTVGVWDTGTDTVLFEDRLWTNPNEIINGRDDDGNGFIDDVNGIAFSPDLLPSEGLLRPMQGLDQDSLNQLVRLFKGSRDMAMGIDSDEAMLYRQTMSSVTAEQLIPLQEQLSALALYIHGTATADIALAGNPAARLLAVRFDQELGAVPTPFDEAYAANFERYVRQTVEYLDAAGVRVVNMSWRYTRPQIESSLSAVEPDADRRRERAQAIFATMSAALERAFSDHPQMLFVAGAGNENEDVEFVSSLPAGINLPNVMTVGAVDQALQSTNFTSYGQSIDVYANGQQIPGRVPGGLTIAMSGTSMAAPQVTNLAAKLWAVEPELDVAEVRDRIEGFSTTEGPNALRVIDPAASIHEGAS